MSAQRQQPPTLDEFMKGLWKDNPVFVAVLGMCPALAVTNTVMNSIAMGLATTFVLTCSSFFVSVLRRWIPKPGPWMNELRSALGFVLLATAVWLVWILGRAEGADAASVLLAALVAIGACAWGFSARAARGRLTPTRSPSTCR